MRRYLFKTGLLSALLLGTWCGPAGAANPLPLFRTFTLEGAREVMEVTAADLQQDGKQALLVASRRGHYPDLQAALEIYFPEKGGYPASPQKIYFPQPDEIAFDFAPAASRPGREMVILTRQGLRLHSLAAEPGRPPAGRSDWLLQRPLLLQQPQRGVFFRYPLLHKIDGRERLIVPVCDGALLLDPQRPQAVQHLRVEPRASYSVTPAKKRFDVNYTLRGRINFPKISIEDHNGDGRQDLFFFWQEEGEVFEQRADGTFPAEPSKKYFFPRLSDKERRRGEAVVNIEAADLDGNGLADFVINTYRGSLTNISTHSEAILRYPDGSEKQLVLPLESGELAGALYTDLTGDGKKDLVLVRSPIGVVSIVRALLSKKIYIHFHVVPFNSKTLYSGDGEFDRRVSFDFNLTDFQVVGFLPTLDGDFDGDGRPDALYALNEKEIRLDLSRPKDMFRPEAALRFAILPSKYQLVADLDGDGRSDLVFFYPDGENAGRVTVLLNNGIRERQEQEISHGY